MRSVKIGKNGIRTACECGGCRCSHQPVVWALWILALSKEGIWDQWMDRTRSSGVVKARTIKWLPPGERWNGSLLDEARGQNWDQETRAARPCLSHHHQCQTPDRCDGHNCAGMSSSGSGTRTVAQGVPMPELAVSRRLIIPNNAVPAWKQSCRQPPKARCDCVSPSMPRNNPVNNHRRPDAIAFRPVCRGCSTAW